MVENTSEMEVQKKNTNKSFDRRWIRKAKHFLYNKSMHVVSIHLLHTKKQKESGKKMCIHVQKIEWSCRKVKQTVQVCIPCRGLSFVDPVQFQYPRSYNTSLSPPDC